MFNVNIEDLKIEIVAALLTIAWATTKGREISYTETVNVWEEIKERI